MCIRSTYVCVHVWCLEGLLSDSRPPGLRELEWRLISVTPVYFIYELVDSTVGDKSGNEWGLPKIKWGNAVEGMEK